MKLWKKALSLALCLCLVLSLMPALAPVEAEAASVPTYISGIYFAADKNQSTAKNAVKNAGYTLIDYDLNKGCGASSKYIYMGYKTTSDPSQAITGIFFSDDIKNPAASYTFPYNGKQITANKVSDVDLNSGASGDYIFAYTTTDLNFGNPVTTIQIKGNNSINAAEADGTWTIGRQIASGALYGTDGRNLNAATLGDKIYLHYKQAKALEAKAYFYQMGAQDAVSTVCTSYSGTVYDNYNTIEAKPQILQEVSLGGVTYRFAGWREDTNGYVVTTTKPQMGADKVRYYYAIYDFDITVTFDSDGGNGAPDSFTVTSRAGAWQGTIPPGSTLPFFPISQEGVTVTLPTTVPTKEGTCGFSRWVRICDGTTVEPGGKILMTFARYYSQMRAEYLPHEDSNRDGFCDRCDTPIDQPSVSNGAYQISTKAQLAWFMQKVNKGETSANAVLVNDIDMGGYEWTPITSTGLYYKTEGSDKGYAGTFDGAGYTISNFKITASTTEEKTYGLFGTLSGTVKNLGIRNVTYNFPNGIKDLRAAGIVGQMLPGSTVTDCFVVDSSIAPGKYIVGGVAACNYGGTISNCYTKNVTVKGDDRCGNLVSDTRADNSETDRCGTVINCYTDAARVTGTQTGNLTSNCEAGVTADRFASGEIAYRLGQAWGQTLGKDALPTPGKAQVYYGYTTCHCDQTAPIYTNRQTTAEKPGHSFNENYICTVCELVCTHTEFAGGTCLCGKITGGYCGADEDGKNLTWTLVDGVLTITGTGASAEYTVYTDVPWQQYSGSIKSAVIEEGVTGTANYAFALCEQLTQVQLPSSMETLGVSTFYGCNQLESVIIPQKVTVIPEYAFFMCENLKSITFEGKITTIGAYAFRGCAALTKITLPDTVVSIGIQAFSWVSRLEEIVIPDSTTSIGVGAFMECGTLKNVTIGKGVTQIGDGAFGYCTALETLTWLAEGDVSLGENVFEETNTANIDLLLTYHHADEITDGVNWNGFTFKSIQVLCADGTLNHTTDYTGNNDLSHHIACSTCGYVGDEVHAYGENGTCDICSYTCTHTTFAGGTCICGKITGGYCGANEDGKNLTWTLIDGVLTVSGNGAMKDYNDEDPSWHGMYDQIQAIVIEDGVTTIGNYALSLCKEVVEVEIPDSVTSIGIGAFGLCNSLEKITIPSQVTVISEMAFFQCDALNTVIFNGNVTTIGKEAFYDCLQLTNIVFPDSLQTIEEYAFYQCIKLTEIVIPNHVTSIGENAFSTCLALTSLTIGKSVTQIGNRTFVDCTALETLIWLAEGDVALGVDVFSGTTNTANVDLLLTYHHADEITDLVNWNGYTFKTIRVLCADGTLNHTTDYTGNNDLSHHIACSTCGYVGDEVHAYGENGTCGICSYTCTHTTFAGGTCICGKITGGYCGAEGDGKNLTWTLVDGVLTISGEGAMKDFSYTEDPAPWQERCEEVTSILIEDGVTYLGIMSFPLCTNLTEVQLPDSLEGLGYSVFNKCEKLESIIIPEKVTEIPHHAFYGCNELKSVTFKGEVTIIDYQAFQNCVALTNLTIPASVETIGKSAFHQCISLGYVVIPDKVTTIGPKAFQWCNALQSVTIGKNVTQIGEYAFQACKSMKELIWLAENDVDFNRNAFTYLNDEFEECSYTENLDLVLTHHHADEVTDLVNWNGFTFKSIRVLCADGTLNHTADYTANTDGTHGINCSTCGYVVNEVHAPQYAPKDNATHEMTCTLCGYAATEACSGGEGTATCINRKVCDLCQAPYGELNPNNHAAETYTNGFLDCCGKVYEPATGSGTESDPYKIGNAGQLYWFADQVNSGSASAWAELTADIVVNENVLNADGTLNEGTYRAWTPMGDIGHNYTGTFDGKGYTVSGLYFNDSAAKYVGLFGYVWGGTVQNVGVVDSYLSGGQYVGGVVGCNYNNSSTVTNCYNTGTVSGGNDVGGVVGYNRSGGTVTDCHNTGVVSGRYVGGVVGHNYNNSTVTNCYNSGTVSGDSCVGGVVGYNYSDSTVTDCYNNGAVSGSSGVGGVVGYNSYNSTVTNCYNSGTVSGSSIVGGVVDINEDSTVTNCYYDSTVCSADAIGYNSGGTVTDVLGKTTEQFSSGEVAYLLSQGCTVGEGEDAVTYPGDIWGQNIDGEGEKDAYPVFSDAKVYQILNCNNEPAGYSNTESDALGHDWTDADCDTPKTCTGCGTTEGDALGHDWTDADCDTPKTCKICGTTEGEALGHDWTDADCDTPKTCNRCGTTEGEALGHSWNDATCTDPKTCSVCGETEGEALGHKLVDRICTVCNKMPLRIEMTNIDATGWNGNAIRVCEDGQLIATVTLAEDKTGDIWYYLGDPNKTYEFYWVKGDYCGGCGFAITIGDETVMIAFADVNMEYADGIRIYPACEEHDYRLVKVHEPTCDLWGYALYVCAVCGESKEDDYVPSLGHTIAEDAVGVVTPPTCENDGYTTYECDRCGESFNTLYVPALPHTLGEDGLCSVCGQPYTVPVWVAGIQIDANNLTDVLGDGTVSYDPSANVLTLNGFVYEGTDVGIYTAMSVNIVLLGENTIYTEDYGILSEATDGEITIRGTGTLTINSATVGIEMYHYGQASLVIGGSVTVSAYAEDAEGIACYSEMEEACVVLQDNAKVILGTQEAPLGEECVYVKGFTCGSFTIEDNASISGITTDEEGIYVSGDQQFIVISDNASVYFCADDEALDANTIRISGGTVTAIGGEGYEGIYADELTITGGTVTVSTVEVEDRAGDGVEADCITITGGTLKILSGGLIASMDGGETNVPGTITLGEGVVIASPAGAVLGQFDLTAIGEDMVLAVLDAEGNFADSLIIQFCVHEWADADCDTPKTCILCGATEGEPLGHSYENDVCTICGHIGVPVKLDSASLSFKEKIHYNIFFSLGLDETVDLSDMGLVMFDSLKADGTMDDAIAIYAGAVEMDGKYMVATDGVPAKYMGDTIYFRVYAKLADGSYVYSKTVEYSAVTYAEHILNSDKPESAKALVVAMLNYGAAAQMFFGYNTDNLVNTFLTDEQKALPEQYRDDMANTVPVVAAEKQGIFANNKGFNKRVPAVSFEGAFEINYFFTPAYAPVDGITLYYWTEADFEANEVLTVDNATGSLKLEGTGTEQYRGDIGGIAAKNLSENIYVAAVYSDGTTTWTSGVLGYSIGAYCGRLATNGGTIADLAMATAVYGYHAKAYFG